MQRPIQAYGFYLRSPGEPLEKREFTVAAPPEDHVVVEVRGCGLCHTDLTFYAGHVKTNRTPIVLGHEISGTVVASGGVYDRLRGKHVIVPAVLPCGECELCRGGRSNICRSQKMPGNDFDGGFASHATVPGRFLCPVPDEIGEMKISELSVIADAVTTPYQAMVRSGLKKGELAVVIGVGGIGTYMVQLAKNAGAAVIAVDIDEKKLENARRMGAGWTINARSPAGGDVKKSVRTCAAENGLPAHGWRIFETSGTAAGQETAFSLLSFAGALGIVGFTMDKVTIRLSNIMAFDADVFGNWGCRPELYPAVLEKVLEGEINIRDNIEEHPLESINEIIPLALEHKLERRVVFVP